jgi:hypothetical protein
MRRVSVGSLGSKFGNRFGRVDRILPDVGRHVLIGYVLTGLPVTASG